MKPLGLSGRFVIAGILLVATTAASSAWSAWAFRRVGRVVDATVRDSERTTEATATLSTSLEREDDALLLTLTAERRGRRELVDTRSAVDDALRNVDTLLVSPSERATADRLRGDVAAYHAAGDALLSRVHDETARIRYHEQVNPLLRRAVAETARVRDDHFRSTQMVAAWARDQAARATQILAVVFAAALALSLLVAFYLARLVVLPIGELIRAVEAVRKGEFDRRVSVDRPDELGQLAGGFNRMAGELGQFRRANIGEVIRAKETLEATLSALPDAVVVIEAGGDVSSANPRASAVMRAVRGSAAAHLRDLPLTESARRAVAATLRGEDANFAVDLSRAMGVRLDGAERKLLPRIVPIESDGDRPGGAVLVLSDVTELVRLDEMRMELVAVASHELRTPLTTLRMTLLMLQERAGLLPDRDRELVATALLGVEQLAVTVGEFLDLTRIEAGQLRLHWDAVDVRALIAQVVGMVKVPGEEDAVVLRVQIGERAPRRISGDSARLAVVLSNILSNAVKYAPSGSAIELEASGDDDELRIAITDAGPGVPPEFRQRIFEKFFRVEHYRPGAEQGVRGAGIGLYVAREIVVAHGGSIECTTGPSGRGASFVVRLSAQRPEAALALAP